MSLSLGSLEPGCPVGALSALSEDFLCEVSSASLPACSAEGEQQMCADLSHISLRLAFPSQFKVCL